MTEAWRPLGVDTEERIAAYDALHDGVTPWMATSYWQWIAAALTASRLDYRSMRVQALDEGLMEAMCLTLRIAAPNLRVPQGSLDAATGRKQISNAVGHLQKFKQPLQIADYLLAHDGHARVEALSTALELSKSAYTVGQRAGRPGLTRRVPIGVQVAADSVMASSDRAGVRLAQAWEQIYGLEANASEAYRLAILAVEDAAVPVVSAQNVRATLGTVLRQLEDQADWRLPMMREHGTANSPQVVISMLRMLWHGQHDRHGGQPSAPGNVSAEEAKVAVSLAVTLVAWFSERLIQRPGQSA